MKQMQIHNSTDIVDDIKQIIEQAQADTGETDQVCHTHPSVHVSDRLSRTVSEGCHHPIGAGPVQESDRFECGGLQHALLTGCVQRTTDERCHLQVQTLRGCEPNIYRH